MRSLQVLPTLNQTIEMQWIDPSVSAVPSTGIQHSSTRSTAKPNIAVKSSPTKNSPILVFLHEGLGSITQWRNFPQALCDATGLRGLIYARQGYGLSSERENPAGIDFMHIEAQEVLPVLLAGLKIDRPILVGHSDGASIALLYAAWAERSAKAQAPAVSGQNLLPSRPLALCVMAPHLFVEDFGVKSIAIARKLFDTDASFRERLGKHHRNVTHTFDNWANVWLSEAFKAWNIENEVAHILCPVLAIQGVDDQYGSLAQIRRITELARKSQVVQLLEIPLCKHSPHLEHGAAVVSACARFLSPLVD